MKVVDNNFQSEKPSFMSLALNNAFEEVSEIFELHQNDINSVSSDIRSFEAYLKARNICVPFAKEYSRRYGRYRLEWEKPDAESKEFRLICATLEYVGEADEWMDKERRPLIESPLAVRMAIYWSLPDFMKSLAEHIRIFSRPKPEPEPEVDEPSFENDDSNTGTDEIPF